MKRDVRLMQKRRRASMVPKFDYSAALESEGQKYEECEQKLNDFYQKLKEMKKRGISKWELKRLRTTFKVVVIFNSYT